MDYYAVSSSTVQQIGYDPETLTLAVVFVTGTEYHYQGVPAEVFEQFRFAPSPGRFVNQELKAAGYVCIRVR
jgi:hypothetical protein